MSRASVKLASVRKRLPKGMKLPPEFPAFVKLVTSEKGPRHDALRVASSDATPLLNIDKAAGVDFLPFLRLGDGGVIAFWKDGNALRVAAHDSEGRHAVLALTFRDFLARVGKPSASFREHIELDQDVDTSKLAARVKPKPVPVAQNRRLSRWLESHSLSAKVSKSPDIDKVRRKLVALARRMLVDGLSKVNKPRDTYWSMDIRLVKRAGSWQATYLDYGEWYAVPAEYGLLDLIPPLLPLMKTRKPRYELSIVKDGSVYADGGNQLSLEA